MKTLLLLVVLSSGLAVAATAQEISTAPAPQYVSLGKGVTMKAGYLAQFRYTQAGAPAGAGPTSAFELKTARIKFGGDMPGDFKYKVQLAFDRAGSTYTANSALYDFALSYVPSRVFGVTCGQFSVPVGGETLTPLDRIDFADRYYAQGRLLNPSSNHDTGIMVSGAAGGLQYQAGMFNGNGPNYAYNNDDEFLYAGRLAWTACSVENGDEPASVTAAVNGMTEVTHKDASAMTSSDIPGYAFKNAYRRSVYGGDLSASVGAVSLKGEYLAALLAGRGGDPTVRGFGWHLTGAFSFPGRKAQLLARVQGYDPDIRHRTSKDIKWTTLGANWFIDGQSERLEVDYTVKEEMVDPVANNEALLQFQLSF